METIKDIIQASIGVKQALLADEVLLGKIMTSAALLTECFKNDGKVLFCGNGGSAADAQHLAAEFSGRFYKDRPPLFSEALHVNTSYITAVGNDYSFDVVYERMVQAAGRPGDVLVAISTSGNSRNIVKAAEAGIQQGMKIIGMTGQLGGSLREKVDLLLNVPSTDTPRIQESHILIGHILCQFVEENLFG